MKKIEEYAIKIEQKVTLGEPRIFKLGVFTDDPSTPAIRIEYTEKPKELEKQIAEDVIKLIRLNPDVKTPEEDDFDREVRRLLPPVLTQALRIGSGPRITLRWVKEKKGRKLHSINFQGYE